MIDVLADGGHQVTAFQPFHFDLANTKGLIRNQGVEIFNYYPENFESLQDDFDYSVFWDSPADANPILDVFHFSDIMSTGFKNLSRVLITDSELHKELKSRQFDVMLYEPFEITGAYLANILNLPAIPVLTTVRYEVIERLFGSPSTMSYSHFAPNVSPGNGVFDRLSKLIHYNALLAKFHLLFRYQTENLEAAVGRSLPNWWELVADAPLMFANAHPYVDFAVPTTRNIVEIGGITMDLKEKKVEKLPEEYESILQEKEVTVLISFGSVVRSFEMPEHFKSGIIEMFNNLPNITFIWKYELDDVELQKRLPSNVHLKKWVPQQALLSDGRVHLFITHGGLGSTIEVAHSGKPALMIPVFGDQPHNAVMLARHGGAIAYDKYDLADAKKLTENVKELIVNPFGSQGIAHLCRKSVSKESSPITIWMR